MIKTLDGITDTIPRSTGPYVIRKINEIIKAVNILLDEETMEYVKARKLAKQQEAEGYHP